MFRDDVVEHYRGKGYRVHENVKVRGTSGVVHACELVVQGPLGNLIVAFEDAGGIEGPEIGAVRRAAKDVGATAVVAAERLPDGLQRAASQLGVVLLDRAAMQAPAPARTAAEAEAPAYPPWPDPTAPRPARAASAWPGARERFDTTGGPRDVDSLVQESLAPVPEPTRRVDPGFWSDSRPAEPAVGFDWLPKAPEPASAPSVPQTPARPPAAPDVVRVPALAAPEHVPLLGLRAVLLAMIAGATGAVVYVALTGL